MYKSKKTGVLGVVITIILLILLVILSNINIENLSYIESGVSRIIMPIQNGLVMLKNKIEGNSDFFTDLTKLQEENKELKQKNSEQEQLLRELEIVKAENTTLKEYMNLTEKYADYKTIPAYIIGKDISNYSNTMVINVGEKDGIKKDMTVIADQGLVGHIISVDANTSKVEVIVDPASAVSCTISTNRENIMCRGILDSSSTLKAIYIPTDATLVPGENVETSGLGGIYQKGILIGTIQEVINTKNPLDRYAIIKTAVDFSTLETVLVITN